MCRDRIRSIEDSNDRQESGINAASQDLQQIRVLTANLKQASEQNRDTLNKIKDSNDQQDADAQEMHKKIKDMDERIEKSQEQLSESLGQLNKHIKEQRENATDTADVQQWMNLQVEVGEEREELNELKSSQEELQSGLADSQKLLEGMSKFTEDKRFQRIGGRLEGVRDILGPLGGIFGSGKSKSKPEPTPVRQDGPSRKIPNTERRVYNSALPNSNQLPPRTNERSWSTCSAPVSRGKEPPEWGRRTIVIHPPPHLNNVTPAFHTTAPQNPYHAQEMIELPPPLPARPSGPPTVDSWLNALPAASPLKKSTARPTAMRSFSMALTPPPLPPRRTSDALTVLSSVASIHSALPSSRSSTVSSPSPSPSPISPVDSAKVFSVAELVALIPRDQRPIDGVCCGIDFSQLLLAESLSVSGSCANSMRAAPFSSAVSKKPVPGPKPRAVSWKTSSPILDSRDGVCSIRQRALELESTLRF